MSLLSANLPQTFAAYASHHQLTTIWTELLLKLILYKPEDPLGFLVAEIKRPVRSEIIVIGTNLAGANKVVTRILPSDVLLLRSINNLRRKRSLRDSIVCISVRQLYYIMLLIPSIRSRIESKN
jgi:hypothetical protein